MAARYRHIPMAKHDRGDGPDQPMTPDDTADPDDDSTHDGPGSDDTVAASPSESGDAQTLRILQHVRRERRPAGPDRDRVTDDAETIPATGSARSDAETLKDLRRVRRERRLGDTEWFDVLYRVYLFALVGSIAIVYASDATAGVLDDGLATADILARGPSIAGVVAVLAFGIGLRNGADGGPVSIEAADIRHVLLAPISRQRVLLRPIVQRLRSVSFALGLGLAVIGQFVAREVEGSRPAWAAAGALFGALLGALYVGAAVVAHALRLPRWGATAIAGLGLVWQSAVTWRIWEGDATGLGRIGPANLDGSLLFWGIRQRGIDVVAIALAVALVALALGLAGRLRLEPLERRGQLVSQLRFAATVQDIRTVVLLRRQLRAESVRTRPWFSVRRSSGSLNSGTRAAGTRTSATRTNTAAGARRPRTRPRRSAVAMAPSFIWRRGLISVSRLPISRVVRIVALSALAGVAASLAVSDSPLFLIVFVAAVFFVGLESLEPLAQEIDRPDLTDSMPIDRGWLFVHHLVAPAGLLALAGLVGAGAATIVEPTFASVAFALAVPLAWTGAIGAVVTTVRDAPEPASVGSTTLMGADRGAESPFALPEFAGFSNIITGAMPIVLSAIAALPVLALSVEPTLSTVWRSLLGVALCLAVLTWWIVRRDRWVVQIREFFAAGRAEAGRA